MSAAGSGRSRKAARLTSLIGICSVALLAPLLYPLLTGRVFVYNDLSWFHLPVRYLYQQALLAGDSVLWTPSLFAGMYLHGEGQVGMFHPFHQLLYRLFPLGTSFNLELVANYPLAFAGTFVFLRRLRFSHPAALFGAMLFAFSGFNLLHHHHVNMVAVVAHLPWLLAAADVLVADERRRARTFAWAAIAVILGSGLLIGFPQAVWWNVLALAAFALFRAGETGRWRRLLTCGTAVAVGILLGGIQLLPSVETAAQSIRMDLSRDFALTFSLYPTNLIQLWSPYFFTRGAHSVRDSMQFHEFGIYSGAILPIALIWVWTRRHALPERRALITALTVFAAVMLVLALGRYGGLAWLLTHVPVLQSLRAPVRYAVLMQFALAVLAAITIDDLLAIADGRTPPVRPPAALWIPAALGVATTVALNGRLLPFGPHTFASVGAAAPGVATVAAITLLVSLGARRVRWALGALVIFTAVDLWAWGIRFVYREPPRTIAELTQTVPPAPEAPAESYASAPTRGPFKSDLLVLRGYRLTSGYAGLFPASRHPLDSDVARRLSGTRWILAEDGTRRPAEGGLSRVRILDEEGRDATGSAQLVVDRPGHLVATVNAPGRRVVALTERFHTGWSATAGGLPLAVVRVADDFLGCVVDGGTHQIEFRFTPRSFTYGALLSAIAVALLAGVVIARRK